MADVSSGPRDSGRLTIRTPLIQGHTALRARPGVLALFSPAPGTGKTLAAGVVESEPAIWPFGVAFKTMVGQYICETGRNLPSSLGQAENARAAWLLDEVVTLLGRRPAVTDAYDRYANVETDYLPQLLESVGGVVVLATGKRDDIDCVIPISRDSRLVTRDWPRARGSLVIRHPSPITHFRPARRG